MVRATDGTRDVAIKYLSQNVETRLRRRFEREAGLLMALDSHSIVKALDYGVHANHPFLVLEFVHGDTLDEHLHGHRPGVGGATVLLRQLFEALAVAHDAGIVHRDVKPSNILVRPDGRGGYGVTLIDFGVAHVDSPGAPTLTADGALVGTLAFAAPEQVGDGALGPHTDLYSAGLVALQMFAGAEAVVAWQKMALVARPAASQMPPLPARVPPQVAHLIRRLCAPRIEERLADARSALRALDEDRFAPLGRAATSRANPAAILAVTTGVVLAAGLAVYLGRRPQAPPPAVKSRPVPTAPAVQPLPPAPPQLAAAADASVADAEAADGCGANVPSTGMVDFDGGPLDAIIYVPKGYDPNHRHPVIAAFHPDTQPPQAFIAMTGLDALADDEQLVVVAPRGGVGDVWRKPSHAMLGRQTVLAATKMLCTDPSRVYAVGHGSGSLAILNAGCGGWLAAAAASSYRRRLPASCDGTPPPTLLLNPMKSKISPVDGGMSCYGLQVLSLDEFETDMRVKHRCGSAGPSKKPHGRSSCWTWDCNVALTSCHLDGGHGWPGTDGGGSFDPLGCGGKPANFPAVEVIWSFLSEHSLGASDNQ